MIYHPQAFVAWLLILGGGGCAERGWTEREDAGKAHILGDFCVLFLDYMVRYRASLVKWGLLEDHGGEVHHLFGVRKKWVGNSGVGRWLTGSRSVGVL